jgi:hypothetical protein
MCMKLRLFFCSHTSAPIHCNNEDETLLHTRTQNGHYTNREEFKNAMKRENRRMSNLQTACKKHDTYCWNKYNSVDDGYNDD